MRRPLQLFMVAALLATRLILSPTSTDAEAQATRIDMIALGDSYSAGVGLGPVRAIR